MWRIYKNAWSIDDIRKRMLFTLLIIVLFRIGSAVPVPFIDSQVWQDWFNNETVKGSFLEYFNMLSGDAFSKATLFSLGVNPYITASIVVQLLTVAIPALEKLQKSGPEGQEKISRIVRYTTLGLSILTSYGYYLTMKNYSAIVSTGVFEMFVIIIAYTAGSCMVMWIAEKIDEKGIGNGISILHRQHLQLQYTPADHPRYQHTKPSNGFHYWASMGAK